MQAYHNDPEIKAKYVARMRGHMLADEIIQGEYWEHGKGCAVGCTIHGSQHSKYETELGIPRMIARLEDRIFEGLSNGEAKSFPLAFLEAIPVGADLSLIWPHFAVWLLDDPEQGVKRFALHEEGIKAIGWVAELYRRIINGEIVDREVWIEARRAAYAYADAAAAAAAAAARLTYYKDMAAKLMELLAAAPVPALIGEE